MADYNINIKATDNASGSINKIQGGLAGLTAGAGKFKAALGVAGAAFGTIKLGGSIQSEIERMDDLAKSARAGGATAMKEKYKWERLGRIQLNQDGSYRK